MSFSGIKEHEKNIEFLKQSVKSDRVPHTILFSGPEGVGKLKVAVEFAKYLLCEGSASSLFDNSEKQDSCENCRSCEMINKKIHPDVLIVNFEYQARLKNEDVSEQKSLKIDTLREVVKFASLKPSYSDKKIIIIDNAEKITIDAQNSLLKTLEEPPENTIFILVSSKENQILSTIRSRCYTIKFNRLSNDSVVDILMENGYEIKQAEFLSSISDGSVSRAIEYSGIISLLEEYRNYGELAAFLVTSKLSRKQDLRLITAKIIDFINSYIYMMFDAGNIDENLFMNMLNKTRKYEIYIKHNVNTKMILSTILLDFLKIYYDKQGVRI